MPTIRELNAAIEQSDITASRENYALLLRSGKEEPWDIHDAVYAVVQQVLNLNREAQNVTVYPARLDKS